MSCAFAAPSFASTMAVLLPMTVKSRWQELSAILANAVFTPQGQLFYSVLLGCACVALVRVAAGSFALDRSMPHTQLQDLEPPSNIVNAALNCAQRPADSSPWWTRTGGRASMTATTIGGTLAATTSITSSKADHKQAQSSLHKPWGEGSVTAALSEPAPVSNAVVKMAEPGVGDSVAAAAPLNSVKDEVRAQPEARTFGSYDEPIDPWYGEINAEHEAESFGEDLSSSQGSIQELPAVFYSFDIVEEATSTQVDVSGTVYGSQTDVFGGAQKSGVASLEVVPSHPVVLSSGDGVDEVMEASVAASARGQPPSTPRKSVHADLESRDFLDRVKNPALPLMFMAAFLSGAVDKVAPMGAALAASVFGAPRPSPRPVVGVSSDVSARGRALTVNACGAGTPGGFAVAEAAKVAVTRVDAADLWMVTAPIANLVNADRSKKATAFEVPTIRHKADPIASLRDIQVPTQKMHWDPVAHISSISAPTDNSRYDPWIQIHRVQPPTVRHGADPLAHINNISVPTIRHGADPLAHLSKVAAPKGNSDDPLRSLIRASPSTSKPAWDPMHQIANIDVPTSHNSSDAITRIYRLEAPTERYGADPLAHIRNITVPTSRHGADPLAHLSKIAAPTARHGADPLAHLSSITPPQGEPTDPLRTLLRAERPTNTPMWDPVHQMSNVMPPYSRPMWDPMTAMPDMQCATDKPFWDPISFLSSLQPPNGPGSFLHSLTPPTGKAWFDPLARLSAIKAPEDSARRPGLDMFKGVIRAALDYKSKDAAKSQRSKGLRYPTPFDVVEGRGTSRNIDIDPAPETYEPTFVVPSRDAEDARTLTGGSVNVCQQQS